MNEKIFKEKLMNEIKSNGKKTKLYIHQKIFLLSDSIRFSKRFVLQRQNLKLWNYKTY